MPEEATAQREPPGQTTERIGAFVAYWLATLPFVWWAPWAEIPWFFTSGVASVARVFIRPREQAVRA